MFRHFISLVHVYCVALMSFFFGIVNPWLRFDRNKQLKYFVLWKRSELHIGYNISTLRYLGFSYMYVVILRHLKRQ